MTNCDFCENKINELPRKCKYCGKYFCMNHRLPEDHKCSELQNHYFVKKEKIKESIVKIANSHKKIDEAGFINIIDFKKKSFERFPETETNIVDSWKFLTTKLNPFLHSINKSLFDDLKSEKLFEGTIYQKKYDNFQKIIDEFDPNSKISLSDLKFIISKLVTMIANEVSKKPNYRNDIRKKLDRFLSELDENYKSKKFLKIIKIFDTEFKKLTSLDFVERNKEKNRKHLFSKPSKHHKLLNNTKLSKKLTVSNIQTKSTNFSKKIYLILFILIILILFFLVNSIKPAENYVEFVQKNITEKEYYNISEDISFQKILNIETNQKISTLGYLKKEKISTGDNIYKTNRYIVDDHDNKINVYLGLKSNFDELFLETENKNIYNITGTLRPIFNNKKELTLEILSIKKSEKNKIQEYRDVVITKNVEIKKEKNSEINLTHGLNKIKEIFITCPDGYEKKELRCEKIIYCSDGTVSGKCSKVKPLKCVNGTLIDNSSECGCPYDYISEGLSCIKIKRCSDQTIFGECSKNIPLFCDDGQLIQKASICGCKKDFVPDNNGCTHKYLIKPKEINLNYILNQNKNSITFIAYKGLNEHLKNLPRSISYQNTPPSKKDFILKTIDDNDQKKHLDLLVKEIQKKTNDENEQAKIAISIVQNIPYDMDGYLTNNLNSKYPYEVLYTNSGVCGEKTELLIYLLRRLGFGTAYLSFEKENHAAVGILCPEQYSYLDSDYCFVESTSPNIITYSEGEYMGVGKLESIPEIIKISDGYSLDDISQEYEDKLKYLELLSKGNVLSIRDYNSWLEIQSKYGLQKSEDINNEIDEIDSVRKINYGNEYIPIEIDINQNYIQARDIPKTNNKINYGDLTNVVYINTNSRIDKGCRYVSVKRGSIDYGEKIYVCDS